MVVTLYTFTTGDGEYQIRWVTSTPSSPPFIFFRPYGFGTEQSTVLASDFGYNPFDYVTSACSTDASLSLVTFTATAGLNTPFLDVSTITPNSTSCGYAPACDLTFTSVTPTNCTTGFNNNGTITAIATTSAGGLLYSLDNVNFQSSGVFSNLIPGTYTVYAKDNNGCHIYLQSTVFKFNLSAANEKYEVKFTTEKDNKLIQLKIYDTQNTFAAPIFLTADGNNPIEKVYQNNNEDKYTPIIATSVTVNLIADGLFNPNEFAFSDERRWKAHIYIDGVLDFQGWVMADEIQDLYMDYPYNYQLVLTDGIPSLKGVPFTDLNGIRIFGITQLIRIWQFCFANLGYDIGITTLISSLTIRQASDIIDQWTKTLIWSDQFYDQDGIPDDFYTVLEKTLVAFGLTLYQHKGSFLLISSADLYHNTAGYIIEFDNTFTNITLGSTQPPISLIGATQVNKPVNPSQSVRFDKAISILNGNVDFSSLALLNQDPSFEYGSVEGNLPVGWMKVESTGPINAFMHKDPIGSYLGDWVLRIYTTSLPRNTYVFGNSFITQSTAGYLVDQVNKKVKCSFAWKSCIPQSGYPGYSAIPVFSLLLFGDDGVEYWFDTDAVTNPVGNGTWVVTPNATPTSIEYTGPFSLSSQYVSITTDFGAYKSVSFESRNAMPSTGRIFLRFHGTCAIDNQGRVPNLVIPGFYVDIDELEISVTDADDDYTLQVSEKHTFNNLQIYSKAEPREISASFYTYTRNKYISGNVLYGTQYQGSVITSDMWKYALANGATFDRLPQALFDSIARNYQRPMVIWEGDVRSDTITFNDVLNIDGFPGKKFMIISLTKKYKESICSIVAIEIENTNYNHTYDYTPKYNKSTRRLQ